MFDKLQERELATESRSGNFARALPVAGRQLNVNLCQPIPMPSRAMQIWGVDIGV